MTAETLADAVARAATGMNAAALKRATGLSARTVRELLAGSGGRRFGRTTLDKLDSPLGWAPGTAWRIYRSEQTTNQQQIAALETHMETINRRLDEMQTQPMWLATVVDVLRQLPEPRRQLVMAVIETALRLADEDLAAVLAMMRRLG